MVGWIAGFSLLLAFANPFWLLATAGLVGWGVYLFRLSKQGFQRVIAEMRPGCASQSVAVQYGGWYGTVHSFTFANHEYGTLFQSANQKKLVG